jgi:hypothetical protein
MWWWISLIVAESERRLSRRRQNKSAFRFQRILCGRRYEPQDNRQSFRRGNLSIHAAFSHASLSRPPLCLEPKTTKMTTVAIMDALNVSVIAPGHGKRPRLARVCDALHVGRKKPLARCAC